MEMHVTRLKGLFKRAIFLYAPLVRIRIESCVFLAFAGCGMAGRQTALPTAAMPTPEEQQVVGGVAKTLYLAVSRSKPRSSEQQHLVLRMAETAKNGKELLMAMRAGMGVFPPPGAPGHSLEGQVRSIVTGKMLRMATLDQLADYASRYGVDAADARPVVERMFELGDSASDPQVWLRIRAAAFRFRLSDLERLARERVEQIDPHALAKDEKGAER